MKAFYLFFSGSRDFYSLYSLLNTQTNESNMLVNKKADMLTTSHVKMINYIMLVVHTECDYYWAPTFKNWHSVFFFFYLCAGGGIKPDS